MGSSRARLTSEHVFVYRTGMVDYAAAHDFMQTTARVLERRVYDVLFSQGDPADVVASLEPYANADGGFGHGLEPDKLVPDSQALDVEIAFERLASVQTGSSLGSPASTVAKMVHTACDWLQTIADDRGAVPVLMPNSNDHPRAGHWNAPEYPPALNPTAAIAGHAHTLGVRHPWLERATIFCFEQAEAAMSAEGHELLGITKFLVSAPDRDRAQALAPRVAEAILTAAFVKYHADSDAYGVTPLDYAPHPDSLARSWFPHDVIAGHLDALDAAQGADGGWDINWQPPTADARRAWRGIHTLLAVTRLRAYGR